MFLHAMIFLILAIASPAGLCRALLSVELLYKKALKTLDKKPLLYHHCNILEKYNLMSFDNSCKFYSFCLLYKVGLLHGLAPPPLQEFIKYRWTLVTRAVVDRDVEVPFRKTSFSHNAPSIKGNALWNTTPPRECSTLATFKSHVKA